MRWLLAASLLVAALLAIPANAQEPVFPVEVVQQCQTTSSNPHTCIGTAALACIENGGGISAVQGYCYDQELQYWEGFLDGHFSILSKGLFRVEAEIPESDIDLPPPAETFDDMNRAWLDYRNARCNLVDLIHSGGRGSAPAYVECEMRATAEHALVLRAMLEAP